MKEKYIDCGDAKFRLVHSDEVIIDKESGKRSQFILNPEREIEDRVTIDVYGDSVEWGVMIQAIAAAVDRQFIIKCKQSNGEDYQVSSNDYFWNINYLMEMSAALVKFIQEFCSENNVKIGGEIC